MAERSEVQGSLRARDPREVGSWRIVRRLGSGSMGRVFLGERGDQLGAVKVIAEHMADDESFRARFARELSVLQRVSGPFVSAVLDADAWADPPFLVTEFIDGTPLQDVVDSGGPLATPAWSDLATGMLVALIRIHDAAVVHRDIKPENIIMSGGRPCLIDFGVAALQDGTNLTRTSTVIGTFGWMAPERLRGERASAATDIFSLGAVLAFAGTGRPPFDATDPVTALMSVLAGSPDLTGLDPGQLALVEAMMTEAPGERPSAREALALLARAHPQP